MVKNKTPKNPTKKAANPIPITKAKKKNEKDNANKPAYESDSESEIFIASKKNTNAKKSKNQKSKISGKEIKPSFTDAKNSNKRKTDFKNKNFMDELNDEDLETPVFRRSQRTTINNNKNNSNSKNKQDLNKTLSKNLENNINNISRISINKSKNKNNKISENTESPTKIITSNYKKQNLISNKIENNKTNKKNNPLIISENEPKAESQEEEINNLPKNPSTKVESKELKSQGYRVLSDLSNEFNNKFFSVKLSLHARLKAKQQFFQMQIIEKFNCKEFFCWIRNGEEGSEGQEDKMEYKKKKDAISFFLLEYKQKISEGFELVEEIEENLENSENEKIENSKIKNYNLDVSNNLKNKKNAENNKKKVAADKVEKSLNLGTINNKKTDNDKNKNYIESKNKIIDDKLNTITNKVEIKKPAAKKNKKALLCDQSVKELLDLLLDEKLISTQIKEIGFDARQLPLDRLAPERLQAGLDLLCEIEQVLKKTKSADLFELSARFYKIIPLKFGCQ